MIGRCNQGQCVLRTASVCPVTFAKAGEGRNDGTSTAGQQNKFALKIEPGSTTEPPSLADIYEHKAKSPAI